MCLALDLLKVYRRKLNSSRFVYKGGLSYCIHSTSTVQVYTQHLLKDKKQVDLKRPNHRNQRGTDKQRQNVQHFHGKSAPTIPKPSICLWLPPIYSQTLSSMQQVVLYHHPLPILTCLSLPLSHELKTTQYTECIKYDQ